MSEVKGKVGPIELTWKTIPRGPSGNAVVLAPDGREIEVRWRRDSEGLWIELPHGVYGYDITAEESDEGRSVYTVSRRGGPGQWRELTFQRVGELSAAAAAGGVKNAVRVRAQMPGKIIRLCVKPGDRIERDVAILVMEAMKMENEVRAPHAGRIGQIKVSVGQAVETGADLCVIDPA